MVSPQEDLAADTDPPLSSVLQMGGGAVQARAAGIYDQIPAAGWETTVKHFLIICTFTDV